MTVLLPLRTSSPVHRLSAYSHTTHEWRRPGTVKPSLSRSHLQAPPYTGWALAHLCMRSVTCVRISVMQKGTVVNVRGLKWQVNVMLVYCWWYVEGKGDTCFSLVLQVCVHIRTQNVGTQHWKSSRTNVHVHVHVVHVNSFVQSYGHFPSYSHYPVRIREVLLHTLLAIIRISVLLLCRLNCIIPIQ